MDDYVFCTVNDVKDYTKIGTDYTRYDGILRNCIAIASEQIKRYMPAMMKTGLRTVFFAVPRWSEGSPTFIRFAVQNVDYNLPIVVKYDATGVFNGWENTLTLGVDYTIDQERGGIFLLQDIGSSPRGLKVTLTGGYELASDPPELLQVPANIKIATALQAGFLYNRITSGALGKLSEEKEGTSRVVYTKAAATGLLDEVRSMLGTVTRMPFVGKV